MANKKEKTIEISSWIIISILLMKFIPKNKIREALLILRSDNMADMKINVNAFWDVGNRKWNT